MDTIKRWASLITLGIIAGLLVIPVLVWAVDSKPWVSARERAARTCEERLRLHGDDTEQMIAACVVGVLAAKDD